MDTQVIYKKRWPAKLIVALLIVALAATAVLTQLGSTLAAPADVVVTLQCETGIPQDSHVEKGIPTDLIVFYLAEARSSDTSIATATYTPGETGSAHIVGITAGVVHLIYGNIEGRVGALRVQITDSDNISGYTLKEGGNMYFTAPTNASQQVTKASPVVNTIGQFSRITWSSLNPSVATVASNGAITSVSKGATVIIGKFTDKWGTPRDLHILVGVGVYLDNNSDLGRLLELIAEGERILAEVDDTGQSPYTQDSINTLQNAVNQGKNVVNSTSPTDQQVTTAINNLQDAIDNMAERLGPDVIPGDDGNYYKPVPGQDNVFEEVNKDGSSKYYPPRYVWGGPDRRPGTNDDKPAYPMDGNYYVEDPAGSNIWKYVNSAGNLQNDPAIWGGPDGKLGGTDDAQARLFGGNYWVDMGQNIWRQVESAYVLGPLTGGGLNRNPSITPYIRPIFFNTNDGKYYVGPLGPDWTGNEFYYGDNINGTGNGLVDSTHLQLQGDDVKYYRDANGNMVTTDPSEVVSVSVNPSTIELTRNSTFTFTGTAIRSDGTASPEGVTWSVTPTSGGSSINAAGVLSISSAESNATLTVRATSVKTSTAYGTATVTVRDTGPNPTDPQYISISPTTANVQKGTTQAFTAQVYQYNGAVNPLGVTWTVNSTLSSISSSGLLTVGANETAASLTVTARSVATPQVTATASVMVSTYNGTGLPGLDDISPGETITIDGIEWIKVKDDTNYTSGAKWSLLIMKGVLYPGNPTPMIFANTYEKGKSYYYSDIKNVINGWYYNSNMPTLKKYACSVHMYVDSSWCFGYVPPDRPDANVAFIPHVSDIYPYLSTHQLENGYRWWTSTYVEIPSGWTGYKKILAYDGSWVQAIYDTNTIYARPAINVFR